VKVYDAFVGYGKGGTLVEKYAIEGLKHGGKTKFNDQEILTMYMLAVLRKQFANDNGKWKLIEKKTLGWLKKQGIKCGSELANGMKCIVP